MNIQVAIDYADFSNSLNYFQRQTQKGMGEVIKQQAILLAKRIVDFTYPVKSKGSSALNTGKNAVERDIKRVYLRNDWWEDKFNFKNQKIDERIKKLVKSKKGYDLDAIFKNSNRLSKIHIETFDESKHKFARREGKVNYHHPYSYPLYEQTKINKYVADKKKEVGTAKSGFGHCIALLGGNPAAWINKPLGKVEDQSGLTENPYIIMTNQVSFFGAMDSKYNIISRALQTRSRDMVKNADTIVRKAAREAGLT